MDIREIVGGAMGIKKIQADGRNPKDQRRKTDRREQDTKNQNENERKDPFKPVGRRTRTPTEGKEEGMRRKREEEKMEIVVGIIEIEKI